jgi:DNA-binding CsgD family transcriptional regulator
VVIAGQNKDYVHQMKRSLEGINRFATLLSRGPSMDDLLSTMARDFLSQENVSAIEIQVLASTDDLELRYSFGAPIDGSGRKSVDSLSQLFNNKNIHSDLEITGILYNSNIQITATAIALDSSIKGFYIFQHGKSYEASEVTAHYLKTLSSLTTIFLNSKFPRGTRSSLFGPGVSSKVASNLTPRQLMILAGMVDGKTNPELSAALGYSVSTIRHETMEIFKVLGASDRKEAASMALTEGLL